MPNRLQPYLKAARLLLLILLSPVFAGGQCDHSGQSRDLGDSIGVLYKDVVFRPNELQQVRDYIYARDVIDYNGVPIDLDLDLYYPKTEFLGLDACGSRPLLLYVHGGGFVGGDKITWENTGRYWASKGYIFASINYRLTCPTAMMCPFRTCTCPDEAGNACQLDCSTCEDVEDCNHCPEKSDFAPDCGSTQCNFNNREYRLAYYRAIQDGWAAINHLLAIDTLHIDPEAVFVSGNSAGAATAYGLGFVDEPDRPDWVRQKIGPLMGTTPIEPFWTDTVKIRGVMAKSGAIGRAETGAILDLEPLLSLEEARDIPVSMYHATCEFVPFYSDWANLCDPSLDDPADPQAFYLHGAGAIANHYEALDDIPGVSTHFELHIVCNDRHRFTSPPETSGFHMDLRAWEWTDFAYRVLDGSVNSEASYRARVEFPDGWNPSIDSCYYYSECVDVCTDAGLPCAFNETLTQIMSQQNLAMSPNPNNGRFQAYYESDRDGEVEVEVFNSSGQRVYFSRVPMEIGTNMFKVRLSNPEMHGTYILRVDGRSTAPFIISKTVSWAGLEQEE